MRETLSIVSAIPSEVRELVEQTGAIKESDKNIWRQKELNLIIASVGVGYLEAAINLQILLNQNREIKSVIFCGTAGVYQETERLAIGQLASCESTLLCDGAAELKQSQYVPILKREEVSTTLPMDLPVQSAKVVTALTLTINDQLANIIRKQTDGELENMELYGIARVCEELSIPWNALLGVTNKVGSSGHEGWLKNHEKMENLSGKTIAKWLKLN